MAHLIDCARCRREFLPDAGDRRRAGCGWLAPIDDADPWCPVGYNTDVIGKPHVCAGYTTALPDVRATVVLHRYLERGALAERARGPLSDHAVALLDAYDVEDGAAQAWALDRDRRKDGA